MLELIGETQTIMFPSFGDFAQLGSVGACIYIGWLIMSKNTQQTELLRNALEQNRTAMAMFDQVVTVVKSNTEAMTDLRAEIRAMTDQREQV